MKLLLSIALALTGALTFGQTFEEILKVAAVDRESEDRLGYSVDISGNYAVIGAYGDDFAEFDPNMGSAYIFEKTGLDNWTFVQKINNSDQDDYDRFGWSVAIDGDYIVVGAYGEDHDTDDGAPLAKAGSAYIFERGDDGVWTEMQKIVASDRIDDAEYGWSVDIYGTTVIVGAHHEGYDEDGLDFEYHAGAVYTYDLVDGTWVETQKLVPSDRSDDHVYPNGRPDPDDEDFSDLFGGSVAIWGDYLIAGSHMHDYGAGGVGTGYLWNAGTAYIFERVDGTWTEVKKLLPAIRKAYDRFGYAVDIDSSIIVVGVYSEDESEFEAAPLMNAGSAYIFERDDEGDWLQIQKLDASDRTTGDHFGRDVAIDDNYLVIGAEQEDLNEDGDFDVDSLENAGAAYIFEKDDDGVWTEIQKIVNSDRNAEDYFGEAVSISDYTIFVGAWQQDLDSVGMDYAEDAGAGYFFSEFVCEEEFSSQDVNICSGESYDIGENSYTVTGTYVDTLANIDACDSIVTTNLTVIEPTYTEDSVMLCFGETYTVGDNTYDETGFYIDTLTAMTGCDSIVGTDLFIEDEITTEQEATICAGESFAVGESVYTETGTYIDVLTAESSCDSTVITALTVLPAIDVSISMVDVITLTGGDPAVETTTFQWIKCDPFEVIDGETEDTFVATENGTYAVIITDGDCVDTSDCATIAGVGIDESLNSLISIYPNPTTGEITIETGDFATNGVQVIITNSLGAIVYQSQLTNVKTILNLADLSNGIYILQITDGERTVIEKISKQ